MERLTKIYQSGAWGIDGEIDDAIHRLADIEDILGDTYDLDRLRELVEACKGLEPEEIEESKLLIATRKDPEKIARVAELVNADKAGRCVVFPCKDWLELVFGDQEIFYAIDDSYEENKIREITVRNEERFTWFDGWKTVVFNGTDENGLDFEFSPEDIGEDVFLTREEAEQALEGMKDNG